MRTYLKKEKLKMFGEMALLWSRTRVQFLAPQWQFTTISNCSFRRSDILC